MMSLSVRAPDGRCSRSRLPPSVALPAMALLGRPPAQAVGFMRRPIMGLGAAHVHRPSRVCLLDAAAGSPIQPPWTGRDGTGPDRSPFGRSQDALHRVLQNNSIPVPASNNEREIGGRGKIRASSSSTQLLVRPTILQLDGTCVLMPEFSWTLGARAPTDDWFGAEATASTGNTR
jgi:hypothetical protein